MSNLPLKNKNVIHLTTSETLRLTEEVYSNQPKFHHALPTNKKTAPPNSSNGSFQITSILNRSDLEYESADDLDESHTDEASSRITDNETSSYSEDSEVPLQLSTSQPEVIHVSNRIILTLPSSIQSLDNAFSENVDIDNNRKDTVTKIGRFEVVKVDQLVPQYKGRWTCYDYGDNIKTVPNATENLIYTQSSISKIRVNVHNPNNAKAICGFIDSNQNVQILSQDANTICHKKASTNIIPLHPVDQISIINRQVNDNLCASVTCTSIDSKIEQALDVVKTHLRQTVRMEVEELKIKINELVERISFLEYENSLLRANVKPDVLATLGNNKTN